MSRWNIEEMERNQKAMYWQSSGYDKFGEFTVLPPVELNVRWENYYEEAKDPRGATIVITAMIVVDRVIPIGSIFWEGSQEDYDATETPIGYKQAVFYGTIPDIKNMFIRKTVKLISYPNTLPDLA